MPKTQLARKNTNKEKNLLPVEVEDCGTSVGQQLRVIRTSKGLTMRSLAEISGLNINTLSLIENGRTSPSVSTLQQLAQSLQVPITNFFETDRADKEVVYQKKGYRSHISFEYGTMENMTTGMPHFGAEPLIVTLKSGADSGKSPIVHTGREFVYCIEGKVTYTVNNQTYLLEPGDSLAFEAYLPHHWKNPDSTPARVLLVLCPMDIRDSPVERHFTSLEK